MDDCVDLERDIIIITKAVRFKGNKGNETDPKTTAGKREVPLLDILKAELEGRHGKLFPGTMTTSKWKSLWSQYIHSLEAFVNDCPQKRWFHRTVDWIAAHPEEWRTYLNLKRKNRTEAEAYRLKEWKSVTIRPHDLRHSYCTTLRDCGVDLKLAIRWMGHADEKMILRIYDHPPESRVQNAIKTLNSEVNHMQKDMQKIIIMPERKEQQQSASS